MASMTSNPSASGLLANRPPGVLTMRIEPPSTWFELRLQELWKYRELLFFLVWRDVKVRYKQSAIGVCAFHQNHDYGYHPEGSKGVWEGEEAQENYALLEHHRKFRTPLALSQLVYHGWRRSNPSPDYGQSKQQGSESGEPGVQMALQTEYYIWHTKYHDLDPAYDDTSSPWDLWVAQRMIDVRGLRTLEVACGRGGFVRALAPKWAEAYELDFSRAALRIGYERSLKFRGARSVFLRIHTV